MWIDFCPHEWWILLLWGWGAFIGKVCWLGRWAVWASGWLYWEKDWWQGLGYVSCRGCSRFYKRLAKLKRKACSRCCAMEVEYLG